jgi:hypothetical protein
MPQPTPSADPPTAPPLLTPADRLRRSARELFSVDLRSLALLRIGLAIAILLDLAHRSLDLRLLYTDAGALPRDLVLDLQGRGALLSIHYWASVSTPVQAGVFGLHALFALALLVGWRTWLATLACWYFASSLQIRQPLVYMGGDSIVRLLLFWGLFLPLGARFSFDVIRGRVALAGDRLLSGGTVALLLQVCLIYWATGLAKDGDLWRTGQAVFYALHSSMATPFGAWLREASPAMLRLLSDATLIVELFGPLLAFVPIYTPVFRLLAVALFWGFHLGLAAAMNIGLFPVFSMVAWLPFIPTEAWRRFRPGVITYAMLRGTVARLASIVAIVAIVYVVVSLAERNRLIPRLLPEPIHTVGWALRLQQAWDMFAPDPPRRASTFIVRRTTSDGTTTDSDAATTFRAWLYFGYLQALAEDERTPSARQFARYWCNRPDIDMEEASRIQQVEVLAARRQIQSNGYAPPTTTVLVALACGDEK